MNRNDIELITDVDLLKRTPAEWAQRYRFKLYEPVPTSLWSEFEWAYHLPELAYVPELSKDTDLENYSEKMELRAFSLRRDLFMTADVSERSALNSGYVDTDYVRSKLALSI